MTPDKQNRNLVAILEKATAIAKSVATVPAPAGTSQADQALREAKQVAQYASALLLAIIGNEPCPVSLFKPWASYAKFWEWERSKKITLHRKNRKACVKPNDFFALWRDLRDEVEAEDSKDASSGRRKLAPASAR